MLLQGDSATFFLIQCKEHSHYRVHHLLPHIQQHLWLHALVTRQQLEGQEEGEGEGTVAQQRHISLYSNAAHTLTTYAPDVTTVQRTHEPHRPQKAASTNQHTHTNNISPPLTIMLTSPYVVVTHDHVYSTERAHAHCMRPPLHSVRTTSMMSQTLFCSSFSRSRPLAWGRVNQRDWKTLVTRFCTKNKPTTLREAPLYPSPSSIPWCGCYLNCLFVTDPTQNLAIDIRSLWKVLQL